MDGFYTPEHILRLRRRAAWATRAALALAGVTLAVCAALCLGVRTANAPLRQGMVIAVSTLGAWTALLLRQEIALSALRQADHVSGVLNQPPELWEGILLRRDPRTDIPKSISFFSVSLQGAGEDPVSLKLNTRFAAGFPAEGRRLRVEARRGYITSWEVLDS